MNRQSELPVRGMDCASCASVVRSALESVDGVTSVDVRLAAEKAVVEWDDERTDTGRLADAVASAGYRVPGRSGDNASPGAEGSGGDPPADRDEGARERFADAERFTRRAFRLTGLVFGAVLVVVVLGEWAGLLDVAAEAISFPVGVGIVLLVGWPAFVGVVRAALHGRIISHTLMAVGVLAALAVGQWVTAAVVAFFMRVGDFVEGFTFRRGTRALRELEELAPRTARKVDGEVEKEVPLDAVEPGDLVAVRPGERIPVDGRVVGGWAAVEQASITGESVPVEVEPGDTVFASTIPRGGSLRVEVTRVGSESTFGRIVRMVENAEAERGSVERFADRFSTWYLPVVGLIALATFLIRGDALATAAVLVVACSCAFAIATPVAMLATIGASARRGLLIKGGAYLEALTRADVILVDKTGTFTRGTPTVDRVVPLGRSAEPSTRVAAGGAPDGPSSEVATGVAWNPGEILRLAASAELGSEHPLGEAIRSAADDAGLSVPAPTEFRTLEGIGVEAVVEGRTVRVGSRRILASRAGASRVEGLDDEGLTLAYVVVDGGPVGAIGLRDRIRDDVPEAVEALRELGLDRIEILTGDREAATRPVAESLGVEYRAELLPEEKIRIVREYQERGHTVVMIGDGVNDAPALAQADVGMAMGAAGTDLALEVAHVALMRDDWSLVPEAFRTARRTLGVVKGNFALTGAYNAVGLTLAALGILPPILAAAAQSIPDLGILGNSVRLLRS